MTSYSSQMISDLLDGTLPLDEVARLQRDKDLDRFTTVLKLEQARVPWEDRILVPLQESLYVVERSDGARVVKCRCGQEFGDYRQNWKEEAAVCERHPQDGVVYLKYKGADPAWQMLREFYCPLSGRLLETEAVIPGYPVVHEFLPDIEGFYRGWLGRELP